METMSMDELAELLLAALCEETHNLIHPNYFLSMAEIAADVGIEDDKQVIDACHLLEDKGYILLAFDHLTSLSAFITPAGEDYVLHGGETGIIAEYQRFRAARAAMTSGDEPAPLAEPVIASSFQPPPASPAPRAREEEPLSPGGGASHIIASMELIVRNDPSLSEGAKNDLVVDLRTLELQMSKGSIRRSVLDAVSAELRGVPALIPLIDFLLTMKKID
jgi:hypothetical protein